MFSRNIFSELCEYLYSDEFFILYGARQVGKTTLLKMLEAKLKENGEISYFFDLENIQYLTDFDKNPENILSYVSIPENKRIFIFIDEIQYLQNPSNFIKYLYDHYKDRIKIICTGSASLEIKSKIQDSLVGRHYAFRIHPLSFFEFLEFKQASIHQLDMSKITENQKNEMHTYLEEFLLYGGMPAVVLKKSKEEKKKLLHSYVQTYIQKDIRSITVISDIVKYNYLMKMIASQSANLLNINNLAENLSIAYSTAKRYVSILKHTHIIQLVPPYLQSVHKQIRKMEKVFFYDTGVRNALLNNFEEIQFRSDSGALFENMMALEFLHVYKNIYYYRTKNDAEIDFIIDDKEILLIEIKYKKLKNFISPKIFYNFGETIKKQRKNKESTDKIYREKRSPNSFTSRVRLV